MTLSRLTRLRADRRRRSVYPAHQALLGGSLGGHTFQCALERALLRVDAR